MGDEEVVSFRREEMTGFKNLETDDAGRLCFWFQHIAAPSIGGKHRIVYLQHWPYLRQVLRDQLSP